MTDFIKLWQEIEEAFDLEEDLDAENLLKNRLDPNQPMPESLSEAASDVLKQAFGENQLPPGLRLSKYRITQKLDSGGQSEIYLADRSDGIFSRTVVIKFMAGEYAGDELRQQFLKEMQLLSDLNHPGIVHMLDGGITDHGQPWLVLDFVPGEQLDRFCSEQRLGFREIVSLAMRICEALSYIHLKGVVHLDLKPGNVLVMKINGVPFPVIIDFGIALRTAAGEEESARIYGTRGFAAPEQLNGAEPDARSDLHALGILLAQLLTQGVHKNIGLLSARQREKSLASKGVPPDLIQIIRRCTDPDLHARYPDADTVRTDLSNFLNDFPLLENRSRPVHVLAKMVERHKWLSALLLLLLFSGMAAAWKYTQDIQNLQQATLAEKQAGDALNNYMMTDLFQRLQRIGRIDLLQEVAERSILHLERQGSENFKPTEQLQSAIANINAGRVMDALQLTAPALAAYERASAHLDAIRHDPALNLEVLKYLALLNSNKAETLATEGQFEQTEQSLLDAINYSREYLDLVPEARQQTLWEAYLQLGWHYMEYDRPESASQALDTAMEIALAKQTEGGTQDTDWSLNLSQAHQARAWLDFDYGESAQALEEINAALALAEKTISATSENIEYLDNLRILLNQKAFFLIEHERFEDAAEALIRARDVGVQLQWMAPQNREYQRELAYTYSTAGNLAETQNDSALALKNYLNGLEISRAIYHADTSDFSSANDLAIDLTGTAVALEAMGNAEQAQQFLEEAVQIIQPVQSAEPANKYYMYTLAVPLIRLQRYSQAKPLISGIRETGLDDKSFQQLLRQHALD